MMKNMAILTTFIFISFATISQDLHYSQIYMTPMALNPALTGGTESDGRISLNYRDQWRSWVMPMNTSMGVGFDAPVLKKKDQSFYLGLGGRYDRFSSSQTQETSNDIIVCP